LESLYVLLKRWATPRNTFIALALLLVSMTLLSLADSPLAALAGGEPKLDLRFGYSLDTIHTLFAAYGEHGRRLYAWNLVIDTPFLILVAVTTVLFVVLAFERHPWDLLLSIAPLAFMLTDLIENTFFFRMLATYPNINPGLAAVSSVLTQVKRAAWYISAATLIASLLIVIIRAGQKRLSRQTG
jgi:hypothetical protein